MCHGLRFPSKSTNLFVKNKYDGAGFIPGNGGGPILCASKAVVCVAYCEYADSAAGTLFYGTCAACEGSAGSENVIDKKYVLAIEFVGECH